MIKLVIADDHQIFRESLALLLEKQGFQVLQSVANGKELVDSLRINSPDLIITDISMPEMDGYDATIQIISKYPDMKILALSSFGEEKYS